MPSRQARRLWQATCIDVKQDLRRKEVGPAVPIDIRDHSSAAEAAFANRVMRSCGTDLSWARSETASRLGVRMLRITVDRSDESIRIKLEGRIAGPEVAELGRTWKEISGELGVRKLTLDLRDVSYSDPQGIQILRDIYSQAQAELIVGTLWSEYLANEVKKNKANRDIGGTRR